MTVRYLYLNLPKDETLFYIIEFGVDFRNTPMGGRPTQMSRFQDNSRNRQAIGGFAGEIPRGFRYGLADKR